MSLAHNADPDFSYRVDTILSMEPLPGMIHEWFQEIPPLQSEKRGFPVGMTGALCVAAHGGISLIKGNARNT